MPTNFPGALDAFPNPGPNDLVENATLALDHDQQHGSANDAIEALEAKVGITNSAVTTSLDYKVNTAKYISAATFANTAVIMQKLKRNVSDAQMLFIGDSTGNGTEEWIYLTATALAAKFPAYTVTFQFWDETGNASYNAATTIQTGSGSNTLRIYNCAKTGETAGYVLGTRWTAAVAALDPDLIWISHGHNHFDPTGTTFNPQIQRNQYLCLTEEVTAQFPIAGIVLVAQNPSTITGRETWQAIRASTLADIAALRGYGFLDVHQAFNDNPGGLGPLMADTTHPNATGHSLWSAIAGDALTNALGSVSDFSKSSVTTQAQNILTNFDFSSWAGTDPDGWVPTLATTSKDTTNFETGFHGCKITATAGSGSAQIEQTLNLATAGIKHLKGQVVTAAMRVFVPAANTAVVRLSVLDSTGGANIRSSDVFASTRDRFVWVFATKRLDAAATTVSVRCLARTSGTAIVDCTVDRVYLVQGALPHVGATASVPASSGWTRSTGLIAATTVTDDLVVGHASTEWTSGTETKMFFDESKGAFRAGTSSSTLWDDSNRGTNSTAFGTNTQAFAANSFAAGTSTSATNTNATAFGSSCNAGGTESFAVGASTSAAGIGSVASGSGTAANGSWSVAGGHSTVADGYVTEASGYQGKTLRYNQFCRGTNAFAVAGDAQVNQFISNRSTTDATPSLLFFDRGVQTGNAATLTGNFINVLTIPVSKAHRFRIEAVARRTDSTSDIGGWTIKGTIGRGASGNAFFVSTPSVESDLTAGAAAWTLAVTINTADSTNNYLVITATGQAAATIRWVAGITTTEVG